MATSFLIDAFHYSTEELCTHRKVWGERKKYLISRESVKKARQQMGYKMNVNINWKQTKMECASIFQKQGEQNVFKMRTKFHSEMIVTVLLCEQEMRQ